MPDVTEMEIEEGTARLAFVSAVPSIQVANGEISEEIAIMNIVFGAERYVVPTAENVASELANVERLIRSMSRNHTETGSKATLWHACSERALSGISGCRILQDAGHMFCMDAISRTILEGASRLYGFKLAKSEESYIENRMNSRPMGDDVFAHNGKRMSDTSLVRKMEDIFPSAYHAYDRMSSGIHIDGRSSARRVFRIMQNIDESLVIDSDYHINPETLAAALIIMRHRASCLMAWWVLKETLDWSKS